MGGSKRRDAPARYQVGMYYKHGHCPNGKGNKTWKVWRSMRNRCRAESIDHRSYYFDKGISVCERWETFENFLADMGECPSGKTIDRIDPSLGYCLSNCRWASAAEQMWNRRDAVHPHRVLKLVALSEHYSRRQLAKIMNVGYWTVLDILLGRRYSQLTRIGRVS
jgi:hypothetical protein